MVNITNMEGTIIGSIEEPKLFSLLEYYGMKNNPGTSIEAVRAYIFKGLKEMKPEMVDCYLEWLKSDFTVDLKTIPGGEA